MPVDIPVTVEPSPPRRPLVRGELSGMTGCLGTLELSPAVNLPNDANPASHVYYDMSYRGLLRRAGSAGILIGMYVLFLSRAC